MSSSSSPARAVQLASRSDRVRHVTGEHEFTPPHAHSRHHTADQVSQPAQNNFQELPSREPTRWLPTRQPRTDWDASGVPARRTICQTSELAPSRRRRSAPAEEQVRLPPLQHYSHPWITVAIQWQSRSKTPILTGAGTAARTRKKPAKLRASPSPPAAVQPAPPSQILAAPAGGESGVSMRCRHPSL